MTQLTDKVWAVEVPEDATNIEICNYGLNDALEWVHHIDGVAAYCVDDLPPSTWRFLFTTKTATEDQLKTMDSILQHNNFKEWFIDFCNRLCYFFNRKESLESLLLSKKLNPNNNYALIEKQSSDE